MKIPKKDFFIITSLLLSLSTTPLAARFEGRGGGGRGGGGRPSPSMHREAREMRNLPQNRGGNFSRDNISSGGRGGGNFQRIPSGERREIPPRRDFNRDSPPSVGDRNNLRELLDQKYGTPSRSLDNRRIDRDLNRSVRRDTNVRIDRRFYDHQHWFGRDFFGYHHIVVPPYWYPGWNPWRAAPWLALAGWIAWGPGMYGANVPVVYYDNGSTYTVSQSTVVNNDSGTSSEDTGDTADAAWLPLGVFALQNSENNLSVTPHLFLQLAINKQGVIEGIFYNAATDEAYPVRGVVNQKTQMVAIERSDVEDRGPTVISALYNFTLDTAPVTVEFPNGNKESWQITRVDPPEKN